MLYTFEIDGRTFSENVVVKIGILVKMTIVRRIIGNDEITRTDYGQIVLILIGQHKMRLPLINRKIALVNFKTIIHKRLNILQFHSHKMVPIRIGLNAAMSDKGIDLGVVIRHAIENQWPGLLFPIDGQNKRVVWSPQMTDLSLICIGIQETGNGIVIMCRGLLHINHINCNTYTIRHLSNGSKRTDDRTHRNGVIAHDEFVQLNRMGTKTIHSDTIIMVFSRPNG